MKIEVADLLLLEDSDFVSSVFRRILSREPDQAGLNHYRSELDFGVSKAQIIHDILNSKEGAKTKVEIPGLEKLLKREKMKRNPLLRLLVPGAKVETSELRFKRQLLRILERQAGSFHEISTVLQKVGHAAPGDTPIGSVQANAASLSIPHHGEATKLHDEVGPVMREPLSYLQLAEKTDPISRRYLDSLRDCNRRMRWLPVERRATSEANSFSLLMPVYKVPLQYLESAIASVRGQSYFNWEMCIVDDGSDDPVLREYLLSLPTLDRRIKVVIESENQGIAAATNKCLEISTGDYICLIDNDDILTLDALDLVARHLEQDPVDMLYSDEFKVDVAGFATELFPKPDWSPAALLSCMYTGHFSVYRREVVVQVGGFRSEFDFSQDYDLALRMSEVCERIGHLEQYIYGWRTIPGSAAQGDKPHARNSNIAALASAMGRRGVAAEVLAFPAANYPRVTQITPTRVSIIIPSDNDLNITRSINSIRQDTHYSNYEIIVVTNSTAISRLSTQQSADGVRFVAYDRKFNFSDKCNVGAAQANGEYLVFFNDDVRVVSEDWVERLIEPFAHGMVGIVGPKLLYEDYTIQHAGMITGCRGLVGTAFHCRPHETLEHFGAAIWMREVSLICGALLAIPRTIFEAIDGFDAANAPISHSDVDLCFRVRELGYRCVYTPYATLIHIGHLSIGETDQQQTSTTKPKDKSDIFLMRRWGKLIARDPYYPAAMLDILYHDAPDHWRYHAGQGVFPATGGSDVLIISHDLSSSGAPRVVYEMAKNLRQIGHFVTVMSPTDGPFRDLLTAAGVTVVVDDLVLRNHDSLDRFAKNFDVAICNTVVTWPAVVQLSKLLPVYWYIHEMSLLTHLLGIVSGLREAFDCPTGVWAGSEHAAELIRPLRSNVAVLEYGVSRVTDFNQSAAAQDGTLQVSVFGSFEPRKGQDLAVAAFGLLPDKYRQRLRLNLFGRVLDKVFLDAVRKEANHHANIFIHGELTPEAYALRLNSSDAVLVSSRDDTLPLVSIDALGASKILIVTRSTGTASYLDHGVNGFVAASAAPQDIANALMQMLDSEGSHGEIARRASDLFDDKFSLHAFTLKLTSACGLSATPTVSLSYS